jgi:hypothetical protein
VDISTCLRRMKLSLLQNGSESDYIAILRKVRMFSRTEANGLLAQ